MAYHNCDWLNKVSMGNMFSIPWEEALIIIYFFYGLAFYSMGLALFVESGRASELGFARSMRLLAGFGVLHGSHEWLDMTALGVKVYHGEALYPWLLWVKLSILVTSFLALMLFGEQLLAHAETDGEVERLSVWRLTLGVALLYTISCILVRVFNPLDDLEWMHAADVLARYILGIPSGLLACWALWKQRRILRERNMDAFVRDLTIAAVSLALYASIGQIFAPSSFIFPSNVINGELFLELTGMPIQLFRAVMAAVVTISMIRVLRALEFESQQLLSTIEHARLETEHLSREELARLNADLKAANEETARLLEEVQRRDALRGELLRRTTSAQESERKRIARELHDGTGQALTGLALGLRGLASRTGETSDAVSARLAILESMATDSLGELRRLVNDLRPPQLDDMGLAAALRWLIERMQVTDEPRVEFEVCGEPQPLPFEVETTLFRIAQEGLTNALKYAHASHIKVTLDYRTGTSLSVRDDGRGFDPSAITASGALRNGWGLAGMQERASLIDANLSVRSVPGEGTTLTVDVKTSQTD
jgi:two-component system sensor histidine kinase DegS